MQRERDTTSTNAPSSTSSDSYDGNNVDTSGPLPEGVYEVFREAHFAYQREQAAKREKDREQRVQRECVWDALVKKMKREKERDTTSYDDSSSNKTTTDSTSYSTYDTLNTPTVDKDGNKDVKDGKTKQSETKRSDDSCSSSSSGSDSEENSSEKRGRYVVTIPGNNS